MLGYCTLTIGTVYYNLYLKTVETRTLFRWATYLGLIGGIFSYCFVMRWNLLIGISDTCFMIFDDLVIHTLRLALTILPAMVLFAKITPPSIEGTCFAFLTGTSNFCHHILGPLIGMILN